MSEIEKLYRNAGVESVGFNTYKLEDEYPQFTAKKQLELIKLIAHRKGYPDYEYFGNLFDDYVQLLDFNEALAKLVNILWQDLTEEEKQQVKGILE